MTASWFRPVAVTPALRADVATTWIVRTDVPRALVPDACVDLVWTAAGTVWVCGPETRGWTFAPPPAGEAVGIRFRPGRAGSALGLDLAEIRNQRVPLGAVLGADGDRLAEQLFDAGTAEAQIALLEARALRWTAGGRRPDPAAGHVARRLATDPAATAATLARELGLSERQLLRRCTVAFGYGPSTLRRILRLQRFLRLAARRSTRGLSELALAAGYVDQQHLARDTRAIARATPSALLAARRPTAVVSDPSTTDRRVVSRLR